MKGVEMSRSRLPEAHNRLAQFFPVDPPEHEPPPQLYAVVDRQQRLVVARGMSKAKAQGFAKGWRRRHGSAEIVSEPLTFVPAELLLARKGVDHV
jgi:hypothetical protein